MTDADACARAVAATAERFGSLDVLVANAGMSHRSAFETTNLDVLRRVMEVNFFGAVNCTKAALPHLLASRGLVVAVSSVAGYTPLLARTGYSASKHALHGFFDSLRAEVGPRGVGVMLACPSFIATRIARNALGGDGLPVRHAAGDGRPAVVGGLRRRAHRRGRGAGATAGASSAARPGWRGGSPAWRRGSTRGSWRDGCAAN